MAFIVFYNTTELDKEQLTEELSSTDHHWKFVEDKISLDNCDLEAEIISVFTTSTVTREMIESMPKLALITCRSTGYNHVDLEAAAERNITVVTVPTYGEATVAEYAFTLLLSLTRKIQDVLEVENEKFQMPGLTGVDLDSKTIGIIGTGHIGQKAINMANGFSMNVLAYDAYPKDGLDKELNFKYVSLEELLSKSDYVSLHIPYNKDTHHILDESRIRSMKPGAILINTARGGLVDTSILVDALTDGHLGGAGLDVIEGEQLLNYEEETAVLENKSTPESTLRHSVEISVLKKIPNVIVSPHNAFNTTGAIGRINGTTVKNIIDFYNGEVPHKVEYVERPVGKLVLLRHTESVWNAEGIWSGLCDVNLSEKGEEDSKIMGEKIKELGIDINTTIYTDQKRTSQTLEGMYKSTELDQCENICEPGFNERNYGEYTGMNKWKVKEDLGEDRFHQIRRGWDVSFPNGETLKDVYSRVVPAYKNTVLPRLRQGKNVLIVAHGNSLRALMKYLESIPDEEIKNIEMLMNQIVVYDIEATSGLKKSVAMIDTGVPVKARF